MMGITPTQANKSLLNLKKLVLAIGTSYGVDSTDTMLSILEICQNNYDVAINGMSFAKENSNRRARRQK